MKNDIFNWIEVSPNTEIQVEGGRLRLRLSTPSPVYVTMLGYEILLGVDTVFNSTYSEPFSFRVDSKTVRCFLESLPLKSYSPESSVVFTNVDRNPSDSGSVLAVRAEIRKHALESRSYLADIKLARAELSRAQALVAPLVPVNSDQELASDPVLDSVNVSPDVS